ncbi:MAG: N,N-dimethylformamidase beta subunit family domain-containing protein [Bacteroidota bacterium]
MTKGKIIRKLWKPVLLVSCISLLCAGGAFVYHFYYLFSNSNTLFSWRHAWVDHLDMYTDAWEYEPGTEVQVFVSNSEADPLQLRLIGLPDFDTLFVRKNIPSAYQPVHDSAAVAGAGWEPTFQWRLAADLPTGWYMLEVEAEADKRRTSIFITPQKEGVRKPLAWLMSTNTWNAYNHWGGQSLYSRNHTHQISFNRPQLAADPLMENTYENHQLYFQGANIELPLARLLKEANIPFDVYSMDELHRSAEKLAQYQTLMFSTHPEYWTWSMMHHLNQVLDSGRSALFLGGNTAAHVTYMDLEARTERVYKKQANLWHTKDTAGIRPFGIEFHYLGFHTYAPYEVRVDTSWLLAGTGLKKGDRFGFESESYDYTYAKTNLWRNLWGLTQKGRKGMASGLEIDRVNQLTPDSWLTVAEGLNPAQDGHGEVFPEDFSWDGAAGAQIGYYWHPEGGLIFHTGSISFTGAIPYDAPLRQIVLNAIRKCTDLE